MPTNGRDVTEILPQTALDALIWMPLSIPHSENLKDALPKNYPSKLHDDNSATFQHVVRYNTKDIPTN